MRTLSLFLAACILLVQILKGLSVETSLYPLLGYLFTYADGPVRRALLPTLFARLDINALAEAGAVLARLHVLLLVMLAGSLLGWLARLRGDDGQMRRWLLWLLLASAVLPVLAATTGYIDVLLVLVLMLIAGLLAEGRAVLAGTVLGLLSLQHEMALVPGLALFVAEAVLSPDHRRRIVQAAFVVVAVSGLLLWLAAQNQPSLIDMAQARCDLLRPAAHPLVEEVWDRYCMRQVTATLASDFTPTRLLVLPFFMLVYGVFPVVLLVIGIAQARRAPTRWQGALLLASMAAPYALITIAWDTDRFIVLASVTGWLILDRWLQAQPPPALARGVGYGVAVLVAVQLALAYPAVDVYGQKRVVPPSLEQAYLIDPRSWTLPVLAHYGLVTPVFLDPAICIDLRCAARIKP